MYVCITCSTATAVVERGFCCHFYFATLGRRGKATFEGHPQLASTSIPSCCIQPHWMNIVDGRRARKAKINIDNVFLSFADFRTLGEIGNCIYTWHAARVGPLPLFHLLPLLVLGKYRQLPCHSHVQLGLFSPSTHTNTHTHTHTHVSYTFHIRHVSAQERKSARQAECESPMQAREKSYEKHTENMQIKCENSFTQCAIKENAIIDVQRQNKA